MLKASCHCGAVVVEVHELPARLIDCNCSICRRYAALWGHLTRTQAAVHCDRGALSSYLCNDRVIEFFRCKNCGCVTHYDSVDEGPDQRLSINFRMFSAEEIEPIELRYFDGADSWEFIDR